MTVITINPFATYPEILINIVRVPRFDSEFKVRIAGNDSVVYNVKPNWEDDYDESTRQHDWGWSDCEVNGKTMSLTALVRDIEATASVDPQLIADAETEFDNRYDCVDSVAHHYC